jgi:hypothetical protein
MKCGCNPLYYREFTIGEVKHKVCGNCGLHYEIREGVGEITEINPEVLDIIAPGIDLLDVREIEKAVSSAMKIDKKYMGKADDTCPECGAELKSKWSGVACTKCDYWFCY